MATALPFISAAASAAGIVKSFKKPKVEKGIGYDEALMRSENVLNPLYDEKVNKTLDNLDRSNMARGFYGQLPGDALKRSTAGDLRTRQAGDISSLAEQMYGNSQQYALQATAQAQARHQQEIDNLMGLSGLSHKMTMDYWDRDGDNPWLKWLGGQKAPATTGGGSINPPLNFDIPGLFSGGGAESVAGMLGGGMMIPLGTQIKPIDVPSGTSLPTVDYPRLNLDINYVNPYD